MILTRTLRQFQSFAFDEIGKMVITITIIIIITITVTTGAATGVATGEIRNENEIVAKTIQFCVHLRALLFC
uniref:Uncharacterized protein n=1 Tax=Globodera rostochiensis TaxID=31243 RepID=A0A914HMT8_GLORO